MKAQEEARAASTPDQLQALINARLAKSQEGRVFASPSRGSNAPSDEQQEKHKPPALDRLDTWSKAPTASPQGDVTWAGSPAGLASGGPTRGEEATTPQRGRALIRTCTREKPEPEVRNDQHSDCEEIPMGRLLSTRPQSVHTQRRRYLPATVSKVEHDRASSLPPVATVVWAAARFARNARMKRQLLETGEADVAKVQKNEEHKEKDHHIPVATVIWAAVRFARPLIVSGRRIRHVLPGEKVLGRDVRRQLRLVVAGLMGSGKSTLCRMLAHLLDGVWVNQDEFSHCGRGAKRAFLAEIEREAQDKSVPVLIVDKINTMRQHRREIVDAMQSGVSGDLVFIQMVHPDDAPGRFDKLVQLCISRIQGRGEGHRTLFASNPKLRSILKMTAGGVEPMLADELHSFAARITVDVTHSPTQAAMQLLADLDASNLLGRLHLDDLVTKERLEEALTVTKTAEEQLVGGSHPNKLAGGSASRKRVKAPVWYWAIDFDTEAIATLRSLSSACVEGTSGLEPCTDIHVTLLYLGGCSDKQIAARNPHLKGVEEVKHLREWLVSQDGQEVDLEITAVVEDDRIAAAETKFQCFCANRHPHVTLAHRPGIPPRMSNELLARKAANSDLQNELKPWLQQLGIAEYEAYIREWCKNSDVCTADKIANSAADVVSAVHEQDKTIDEDRLARLKQTLTHAAPGSVRVKGVAPFKSPLKLRGVVRGRLRGG